ncbi:MAG: integrin alpha, partial [Pseudomonadota bacterium]
MDSTCRHSAARSIVALLTPLLLQCNAAHAEFPARFELSTLFSANGGDGSVGVVFLGVAEDDRTGWSVDGIGDINADGFDDLLIGAFDAEPNGLEAAGAAYVVFGEPALPAELPLADLDGSNGFVIEGA